MTSQQRTRALKVLDGAYRHLCATREPGTAERALTLIAECSRSIRNRFNTPITYEFFGFDTPLWDNSGRSLYTPDSIEVL